MAKAVATGCSQNLSLLVLLSSLGAKMLADTHSLRCHFIVKTHPKAGEHWCEGQCSVDGVPFLQYSNQGKEVNATKGCADLYPKLKDTGKELRTLLLHMEKEAVLTRDNHNLQGTMISQYKPGQLIDASWKFTIDGQYAFCLNRYNQKNKKWEVINYNDTGILEQWENNAELAQDLATLSMGDSDLCLKEIFKHQKEMPRPASRTPKITEVTSATQLPCDMNTTQPPPTRQVPENKETTTMAVAITTILFIILIFISIFTWKYMKRKSHPQGGASPQYSSASSSAV
ncbi:retinoic acid early-inducible protein 1-epsilon-like [Cricetulus griseus]|uniref:retinoic acid early-inducible protein 1-epsilon-like n=1 Tax=Cricetulus griseus TaxID=10029 RepID=UPI000F738B6E|nr:retinoic acid early-inducible protein 1-epsilon-like [Cricetulus griseus]